MPAYSRHENWQPDEDDVARAGGPQDDIVLRALSVVPFVLVAAFGVIALVGWIIVIVFGVSAPGNENSQPIWEWVQGQSLTHILTQLALAIGIGLIPLGVMLGAGWATVHGFRPDPHRLFWPIVQVLWGIVATALVVVDRVRHDVVEELGITGLDWWFAFVMVAVAMILAGVRIRRLRRDRQS